IVNGGDAGTAEGDFASCLVWASRPGKELPLLIIVTNNGWGISTKGSTQHGEKNIADRGKAFGMKTQTINGLDVEESHDALTQAMDYVRKERKPYLLEARVSRMYGHSSASGANLDPNEPDPVALFEEKLITKNLLKKSDAQKIREDFETEFLALSQSVRTEPAPDPSSIYDYTYAGQKGRVW
ncbi:thiamine pyrophosphate-dependent enzyme, partial [Bdellovibrionota bacterium FG-2]